MSPYGPPLYPSYGPGAAGPPDPSRRCQKEPRERARRDRPSRRGRPPRSCGTRGSRRQDYPAHRDDAAAALHRDRQGSSRLRPRGAATLDAPRTVDRYTDRTIVDRAQLLEQLQSVIREGYAVDAGEFFEDVASVAVPIRDYTRSVVGSLAVAGPCYRISTERIAIELAPLVLEAGRELSHRLGYNE